MAKYYKMQKAHRFGNFLGNQAWAVAKAVVNGPELDGPVRLPRNFSRLRAAISLTALGLASFQGLSARKHPSIRPLMTLAGLPGIYNQTVFSSAYSDEVAEPTQGDL
jgi:hypothetical protein